MNVRICFAFNRTSLELKQGWLQDTGLDLDFTFNRTSLELKPCKTVWHATMAL